MTINLFSRLNLYINDTKENIQGILDYCKAANCYGVLQMGIGVTLRDGDRQYFYQKLDQHFPGMKERYIKSFGNSYEILSPNHTELMKLVRKECKENHMIYDAHQLFSYMHQFEDKQEGIQLSLFS